MVNWFLCCQHAHSISCSLKIRCESFCNSIHSTFILPFMLFSLRVFVCVFFSSFLPPCIHMSALFSCVFFVMISMFSHLLHVILAFVLKWTRPKFGTITTIVDGVLCKLSLKVFCHYAQRVFAISEKNFSKRMSKRIHGWCSRNHKFLCDEEKKTTIKEDIILHCKLFFQIES